MRAIVIFTLLCLTASLFSVPYKEGFIEADVLGFTISDNYLYYHDYSSFNIVDISNPQNPILVGNLIHPVSTGDFDEGFSTFKLSGNYLIGHYFILEDVGMGSQEYYSTYVFDVSDLSNPVCVFDIWQNSFIPKVLIDSFLYELNLTYTLKKYSIPGHDLLGSFDLSYVGDDLYDIEIHDDILYILKDIGTDFQLRIYDISNFDEPILVNEQNLTNNKLYIIDQILYNYDHYGFDLEVFNISDLNNLINIGQKHFDYQIRRFHAKNDHLYLSQNGSIIIYETTDPSDIIKVSDVECPLGWMYGYMANEENLFINTAFRDRNWDVIKQGIDIINTCDLTNNIYDFHDILWANNCIEIYENNLFIGSSSHLDLYDITYDPILTWSDNTITSPKDVATYYDYIFVLEGRGLSQASLLVFQYFDPNNLELVFQDESIASPFMTVEGDYLYLFEQHHWYVHPTIRIFLINDPTNPIEVSSFDEGELQVTSADSEDNILAVSYDDNDNSRIIFYDITDPMNISEINSVYSIGTCENIVLENNVCVLSDGKEGIQIIDMQNFEIVANIKPNDDTYVEDKVCLIDNYLIFEDLIWSELFCYDISNLANPIFIESIKFNKYIKGMRYYNGNIYGLTQLGLLVMDDQITSIQEITALNKNINISNHPNPFNPTTTIEFSIPKYSKVKLTIFNIKGQKIKTLTNEVLNAGDHSIIWNGDDDTNKSVSSGVYLYKLKVNGKIEAVKKCLLLK